MISVGVIYSTYRTLEEFCSLRFQNPKTSYWLAKFLRKARREVELVEETRKKLILEHSEIDQNGEQVVENGQPKINDIAGLTKKLNALFEVEIDFQLPQVKLEEIPANVSPNTIANLFYLFPELEEEAEKDK